MAELADALDLGSSGLPMQVRPLSPAPKRRVLHAFFNLITKEEKDMNGYFNDKKDEYTLLTPRTRANYRTCLQNNKGYKLALNQFGMGIALCRFKFTQQNMILDDGQRTVYFRDDSNNDLWCVGGFPFVSKVDDYKCTHKQSCTEISSVHNGIRVTIKFFVPVDKRCDIQSVKVENLSETERVVSVFPAVKFALTGFKAPEFANNFMQTYITSFKEEINGVYLDGRNPYTDGMPYNAYLVSTTPVYAYSADDREVFGTQYSLSEPYSIMEGEDLDSKSIAASKLCALLQTKATLKPGETFETDYVLGIANDFESAKKELADVKTHEDVLKLYSKTEQTDRQRRGKLVINTPHEETNYLMNHWLKMGLERNILKRTNPRDNLQFSHAALTYLPEATKYTIRNVMTQQFNDGHLVRSWLPLNTTEFADEPMWLVNTTCDYVKYTNDVEFLDEIVDYLDGGSDTVWVHLLKAIHRVDADRGPHNIPLSHFADWNDALNTGMSDKNAESVFVAMQLAFAFTEMADLCTYLGKNQLSDEFKAKYDALKKTVNETCWDDEGYYIRSFSHGKPIGSSKCVKGSKIFANPQSWAIISGVCDGERVQSVLNAVDKYIDTPVGCVVNYPAYNEADYDLGRISFQYPGAFENGAVYAHATSFKMYADCMLGLGDRAYRSFLQLLPSNPDNPPEVSDTIPYAISNCCYTADVCYGKSSALPFGTGTQAWMFRTVIEGLMGIRFAYGGFKIQPAFPSDWDKADLSLERYGTTYHFTILNKKLGKKRIYVNGKITDSDFIPFSGEDKVEIKVEL